MWRLCKNQEKNKKQKLKAIDLSPVWNIPNFTKSAFGSLNRAKEQRYHLETKRKAGYFHRKCAGFFFFFFLSFDILCNVLSFSTAFPLVPTWTRVDQLGPLWRWSPASERTVSVDPGTFPAAGLAPAVYRVWPVGDHAVADLGDRSGALLAILSWSLRICSAFSVKKNRLFSSFCFFRSGAVLLSLCYFTWINGVR